LEQSNGVEGYVYVGNVYDYDHQVCQIVRALVPEPILNYPTFAIRFADGSEGVAIAPDLHPWCTGTAWPQTHE